MDTPSYLERWAWVGLTLLVFALLSSPAVLVGLVLWLWLHWKPHARWRWVVMGLLLLVSWVGLVLLWGILAGQFVALREAITGHTGVGTLLTRALPVWGEGTLLGPTVAGIVQLFRPRRPVRPTFTQPALPEQPSQTQIRGAAKQLTLPGPAVRPEPPQDASPELPS